MISALLIDDEATANHRLRQLLKAHPEVNVLGAVESVAEAVEFLARQTPDVIFLDMNLPDQSGLELLPHLNLPQVAVVFVTAHEKYAVAAFEAGAVDFLVKPVNPQRLALMVRRLLAAVTQRLSPPAPESGKTAPQLSDKISFQVSGSRELKFCLMSEIVWIEAMQNYTRVQLTLQAAALPTRRLLNEWETLLNEQSFYRLDRSLIIQVDQLRATEWYPRHQSLLTFEGVTEQLPIGRHAAARLKEILVQREPQ